MVQIQRPTDSDSIRMTGSKTTLLSIIELGGYPDFSSLYRKHGYDVISTDSVRKAVKLIRKHQPAVIVAEFNFQSDFRDRTSSLETLFSSLQGVADARVIVFYEKEYLHQFEKLLNQFDVFASLEFPVDENRLKNALSAAHPDNNH
jgi:DNA-binding NtrC family response regulator